MENLFNRYMFFHNAFQDERIIPLWVAPGTPGIRAQYTNAGVYTTWESVTRYHRGPPLARRQADPARDDHPGDRGVG